jgi:truncated hemoglobin YjbI
MKVGFSFWARVSVLAGLLVALSGVAGCGGDEADPTGDKDAGVDTGEGPADPGVDPGSSGGKDEGYFPEPGGVVAKDDGGAEPDPGPPDPGPEDPGPTDPGPTDPGPTDPGPTDPGPADPGPADPGSADPGPEDPGPADPGSVDPGPEDPGPSDPGSADPDPADPGSADPGAADPGPSDPGPTDPGPQDPGPTDLGPEDPGDAAEQEDPGPPDPGEADEGPADVPPDETEATLFHRLGRTAGIAAFVDNLFARAKADARVNAYFLNSSVDMAKMARCLVIQISAMSGSPQHTYPGEGEPPSAEGCRSTSQAHAGLGMSAADFDNLMGHLRVALNVAGVAAEDAADLMALMEALDDAVVEDPDNNATIYQRLGRKPGIVAVVADLLQRMKGDPEIAGFFEGRDPDRLQTCLVRRICAVDGPCRYGEGVEEELRIGGEIVPCRPMAEAHAGMEDDQGSPAGRVDVDAMLGHLADALDEAGAAADDRDAVGGAFGRQCPHVLPGGFGCAEGLFERLGGAEGLRGVSDDLLARLREDPKLNAYFLNASLALDNLAGCLATQLAALAGSAEHSYPEAGDPPSAMGCRSLMQAHAGLGISAVDLSDFLAHLVAVLEARGANAADIELLTSALGAFHDDVVADKTNDSSLYQRLGRREGIEAVVSDALDRVLNDDALKGFFEGAGRERLETCLVRRICAVGGPCHYGDGAEEALRVGEEIVPCRDMATVHEGMTHPTSGSSISIAELRTFLSHFGAALDARGVGGDDRDDLLRALEGMCPMIVAGARGCTVGLFERIGGDAVVEALVANLFARALDDARVNAYFRNAPLDLDHIKGCFESYLAVLLGAAGPGYPGPGEPPDAEGCRNLADAHAGLGVSMADLSDFLAVVTDALSAASVHEDDAATAVELLRSAWAQVVSDADSDATVYQRAGRRPGITATVEDLFTRVLADAGLQGFFPADSAQLARIKTCLVRQICAVDGPCRYGEGTEEELRVQGELVPCKPMAAAHQGVENQGSAVTIEDFESFMGLLRAALAEAGLAAEDVSTVAAALDDLCLEIVPGGEGCAAGLYDRLGGEEGIRAVVDDLIFRLVEDPKVNAYFRNLATNIPQIQICLTRKLSTLAGSPDHAYPGNGEPADGDGCRNMQAAHAGLGISKLDFGDYTAHLDAALVDAGARASDVALMVERASATEGAIVEDATSDATLYQRLGRRPGIAPLATDLVDRLLADQAFTEYFFEKDRLRLEVCLFRWICALDGPCVYGDGSDPELQIDYVTTPCRPIATVHQALLNPADQSVIGYALFSTFLDFLNEAITAASVPEPERPALRESFEGQCDGVVKDGVDCP